MGKEFCNSYLRDIILHAIQWIQIFVSFYDIVYLQKYEVFKTEELPTLEGCEFSPGVVVLFSLRNCIVLILSIESN